MFTVHVGIYKLKLFRKKELKKKSKQAVEARSLGRFGNAHIGIKGGKGYKMSEGGTKLIL